MVLYRYGRWDGTQAVDPFTASDLMEHLADRLLDRGDLQSALKDMLQRGAQFNNGRKMGGLRDLLDMLRQRQQQQLERYNLGSVMDDIQEKLDEVVKTEREGIEKRLANAQARGLGDGGQELGDETRPHPNPLPEGEGEAAPTPDPQPPSPLDMLESMSKKHLEQLDNMPAGVGGRMQALQNYDFMDPEARQKFDELMETLRQQILQNYFQGMQQALGAMTPEMMQQVQQMVRDLNELLEAHRMGDDSGFEDFMEKWGQFFPDGIENVEQLADHLRQQMAQMQSLLDSMTPEMRRELEQMMEPLFQNGDLQEDLADLMANLGIYPSGRGDDGFPFSGDEPITLQEAMRLMGDMKGLEELENELLEAARLNDSSRLNSDEIGRLVGEEAQHIVEELQEFMRMLEEAGFIQRNGKGFELTPRAMRKIGERALEEIFGRIDRGLAGEHSLSRNGWGVERLDETKPFAFGDPFAIDTYGTVMNALRREGQGKPVHLSADDFEVWQSSSINQCSTVILLDMSYSMLHGGRFQAGRKVAMALDSLIRNKFPRDTLQVAAFSYFVLPIQPNMLLDTYWIDPRGTDFPEAIRVAREMLGKFHGGTKQIIMITDGEPHANSTGWGWSGFADSGGWSMRQAMEDTLREVGRCTHDGIIVNTFMLDTEPVVTTFIKSMTRLNSGRVFFADPNRLGDYLIVDYVKNRRKVD
jgi:uncharacterized protein with von Willebrand factor type A (vWA) domain